MSARGAPAPSTGKRPAGPARAGIPAAFWESARTAPARLLALDYDGTLAPFAVRPADARPLPLARRALERIVRSGHTAVAVISGRPPDEVAALLGPLPVPIVGEHGWTRRYPDGALLRHPIAPELVALLDRAQAAVSAVAAPARIERKRASIAVHARGLAAGDEQRALAAARSLFERRFSHPRLELRPMDGGLELRVTGRDKGDAVRELAAEAGPEAFVVVLGDDETDEDAFRAAADLGGWGIRVGRPRPTVARARLASPAAVAAFLASWSEHAEDAPRRTAGAKRRGGARSGG